jgi:hypothetical protein
MGEPRCSAIRPLLSAAIDCELPRAETEAVARHLAACAGCRAERHGLATVRSLLRSLPERSLPEDLTGRAAGRASAQRRRLAMAGTTIAVTVGLLAGAAFSLGGQPPPDTRTVRVPLETFVADHLVHSVNGPGGPPARGGGAPRPARRPPRPAPRRCCSPRPHPRSRPGRRSWSAASRPAAPPPTSARRCGSRSVMTGRT